MRFSVAITFSCHGQEQILPLQCFLYTCKCSIHKRGKKNYAPNPKDFRMLYSHFL